MNEGPSIIPGTWHSVREPETGDTAHVLADERDVTLSLSGSTARVRSLPGSASRLEMDLDLSRRPGIAGNWAQRDDPGSPVLIGTALFVLADGGRSMAGKCTGGDPSLPHLNMGTWTLTLAERHPDDPDKAGDEE